MPRKFSPTKSRPITTAQPSLEPQQAAPETLPAPMPPAKSKAASAKKGQKLKRSEAATLRRCEETIKQGLDTFQEMGKALLMIRDQRLYRQGHSTFREYCQDKWGFTDGRAKQLIAAAKTADQVETVTNVTVPNEAVARELNRFPAESRAAVLQEAVSRSGGRPTAATVRQVKAERSVTCPNCGSHSVDEDGDCVECHEPEIGRPAQQKAANVPAHEQTAARDEQPRGPVTEEDKGQAVKAVPTKDEPAKVQVQGQDFDVHRDGTQWFFRRPTGTGWTCASTDFVKLIEEALLPMQTVSQQQSPASTEGVHFDLPNALCRLGDLATQIENELALWPPEHLGETRRIMLPVLGRLPVGV